MPFLDLPAIGMRSLRIPGVHETVGVVSFALIVLAAWVLGAHRLTAGPDRARRAAVAGSLLLFPYTLFALLWIGLGAPWQATLAENHLRFLVLIVASVAVTMGFVALRHALKDDGEDVYATPALAVAALGGIAYFVWLCIQSGIVLFKVRTGQIPEVIKTMNDAFDPLQFFACALTYLGTLLFAICLRRAGWIGRGATVAFILASALCLTALCCRGLSYPDLSASTAPWYVRPGFFVGIPAVPWLAPSVLGAIALRRAGLRAS